MYKKVFLCFFSRKKIVSYFFNEFLTIGLTDGKWSQHELRFPDIGHRWRDFVMQKLLQFLSLCSYSRNDISVRAEYEEDLVDELSVSTEKSYQFWTDDVWETRGGIWLEWVVRNSRPRAEFPPSESRGKHKLVRTTVQYICHYLISIIMWWWIQIKVNNHLINKCSFKVCNIIVK